MASSTDEQLTGRFDRFDLLLVLISLIVAITVISLFSLFYISTFSFVHNFLLVWTHQLPFLYFEIIILLLMELFSIYFASRIYYNSDSSVLKSNMIRLLAIWCFLIALMLVIAVQFFISKSEISELFLDDFYKGFYDFGADADSTKFVNYVQRKFACCGSENSTDWDLNKPYALIGSQIPDSCCKIEFSKCDKNDASQINESGCASTIIAWSSTHGLIFLVLWFALILLSVCFCFVLRLIGKHGQSEAAVEIRSLFSISESEHLMSANKKLLDYQNSFKKCNPRQVQIGFAINDDQLSNSLNSNLNKLTRYSQIRYSKVKPAHQEADDHAELTCHQEHLDESSCAEASSASSEVGGARQLKKVNSCDKFDKISQSAEKDSETTKGDQRNELQKTPSIRSINRADRQAAGGKPQTKSIKKQSTNKPHKHSKDKADCKSNPNYDPHYRTKDRTSLEKRYFQDASSLSVSENSTKGHSPSSTDSSEADEQADHRNLIHPKHEKTMYNLDKLKNKFIDPYPTSSSYWTDDFDQDESEDVSTMQDRSNGDPDERSSSEDSSEDGCHENRRSRNGLDFFSRRRNIRSVCREAHRTKFQRRGRRKDSWRN